MEKPSSDINVVEVRSAVNNLDLNQMSKHRLSVSLTTRSGHSISGPVRTRTTCELFHAPLATPPDNSLVGSTKSTGMAWMYIDKVGALKYHVRLEGITQPDMLGLGTLLCFTSLTTVHDNKQNKLKVYLVFFWEKPEGWQ